MMKELKRIEKMDYQDILDLKKALLAYDLGIVSNEIKDTEKDNLDNVIDYYYENDDITFFINEKLIDYYYSLYDE